MRSYVTLLLLMAAGLAIQIRRLYRFEMTEKSLEHPCGHNSFSDNLLRYHAIVGMLVVFTWLFNWDYFLLPAVLLILWTVFARKDFTANALTADSGRGAIKKSIKISVAIYATSLTLIVFRSSHNLMNAVQESVN